MTGLKREWFEAENADLKVRNARLVAALEKAIEMMEPYDMRDCGELYDHLRKALADQQDTELEDLVRKTLAR